ncbi:MAG: carbohydrate kinase [Bauldia sp.]|nr:carbohydrate kinase [Bauldia sp.]
MTPFRPITVFGGATMDHAAATLRPPVPGASNPGVARTAPGGVGLNVARDLARLGERVRLISRVGADADGDAVIAAIAADGIDPRGVTVSAGAPTATYRAAFDQTGDLIIGIADMAVFDQITPETVAPALAAASDAEAFVVDANLPAATLATIVAHASDDGRLVAAIAVSPAKAVKLIPLLGRLDLLFATRREALALLGGDGDPARSTADLAQMLSARGVARVVVTDSARPLAVAADGAVRLFTPFAAKVRSVNGAGDALAAGTLHGLAGGHALFEAIACGLAAAAITVEEDGTVAAALTQEAIGTRIANAG